ncbi:hypothetical protein QQS21_010989 [Conoideocrella luteorostrata]|uniref:C2H2-type domain-containing protein n=1 Tax=Conoideocrella luteorostrata TaxID=1105319 RepID=A0AAJ0CIG6_9HYPO|nr:hypothetical protein QQS21_010989 [Conoideocrella luteorostrata]
MNEFGDIASIPEAETAFTACQELSLAMLLLEADTIPQHNPLSKTSQITSHQEYPIWELGPDIKAAPFSLYKSPEDDPLYEQTFCPPPDESLPNDVFEIGYQDAACNWRCAYPGCHSKRVFERACDLRKHFRGHVKVYFCSKPQCQQSEIGFATQKDYKRHLKSHQPTIECRFPLCKRVFSRKDNM